MRIISGDFKGKNLYYLKNSTTRPLKDLVKENIFNIIAHSNLIKINLKNSTVLDLYSGMGSFGIECLSRGAKKVTFVENDKSALSILNKNLETLSLSNKSKVITSKVESFLKKKNEIKYNIFFFDPPFSDQTFQENLIIFKKNKFYKNKHLVIIHRDKKTKENLGDYLNIILTRTYGRSKIIFGFIN